MSLVGHAFHHLTVIAEAPRVRGARRLRCLCVCGTEKVANLNDLNRGFVKSCGCKRGTHGATRRVGGRVKTITYATWQSMVARCHNPRAPKYENYGGRGISVCERWRAFEDFVADMGERPSLAHSIDRKDNSGNYTPENCRWATRAEQARNKRVTRLVTIEGRTQCLKDWSAELGIGYGTVCHRLRKGSSEVEALTRPVDRRQSRSRTEAA